MTDNTVNEIVEKAKAGDISAFDLLYREYNDKLYKYVVKLGVDSYDAEDIVSETFMEAIEHIGDLKNNEYFSTWLHTIAKNKVYRTKNKEKAHARVDFSTDDGNEQNDGLDIAMAESARYNGETVMLPEDYAENEELKQILADTVNSLSEEQRDIMFLYYYEDLSVGQISERVGAPAGTVKSRLNLARKHMLKKIKALQKNGVALCAVPITVIFDIAVKQSKLHAGAAAVATMASASAGASAGTGAAVSMVSGKIGAVIAAGIMIGGGIGAYAVMNHNNDNLKTDNNSSMYKRDASSMDIPDSNINWNPDLIRMRYKENDSAAEEDDDLAEITEENDDPSQAVAEGRSATGLDNDQPTQQTITYYEDADNGEENNGTGDTENGNGSENNNGSGSSSSSDSRQTLPAYVSNPTNAATTTTKTQSAAASEPQAVQLDDGTKKTYASASSIWDNNYNFDNNNYALDTMYHFTEGGGCWVNLNSVSDFSEHDDYSPSEWDINTDNAYLVIEVTPDKDIKKGSTVLTFHDEDYNNEITAAADMNAGEKQTIKIKYNTFWDTIKSYNENRVWTSYRNDTFKTEVRLGFGTGLLIGETGCSVSVYVTGVKVYYYE